MNPEKKARQNRRRFLKAALGCAAALVVPVWLSSEPKLSIVFTPGIWVSNIDLERGTIIFSDVAPLRLVFDDGTWKELPWKDGRFSKASSELSPRPAVSAREARKLPRSSPRADPNISLHFA